MWRLLSMPELTTLWPKRHEKIIRSLLHRLGYRFRMHRKDLPAPRIPCIRATASCCLCRAVFWRGHGCRMGQPPKYRLDYWQPKIESNSDRRKEDALPPLGSAPRWSGNAS